MILVSWTIVKIKGGVRNDKKNIGSNHMSAYINAI